MNPFAKQNVIEALETAIEDVTRVHQKLIEDVNSGYLIKCPDYVLRGFMNRISEASTNLKDLKDLQQYVINIRQIDPLNYSVNLTQDQFKLIQDYYQ